MFVYDCNTEKWIEKPTTESEIEETNIPIQSIDYGEAVDNEIRKRYSASEEFAILRQRDSKPEEYAEYYAYCEECKAYVKKMIAESNSETPDSGEVTE